MNKKVKRELTNIAFRLFGAKAVMTDKHFRLMGLTGLEQDFIIPVLSGIRSLNDWTSHWEAAGEKAFTEADDLIDIKLKSTVYKRASSCFYVAQMMLMPSNPNRLRLFKRSTEAFGRYAEHSKRAVEKVIVKYEDKNIHCYLYNQNTAEKKPALIMLPPLGSIKENIDFMAQAFADAGYVVLTADIPGAGETGGAMRLDSQKVCSSLIDWIQKRDNIDAEKIAMAGLSLGAYWSMKTAAVDSRVKLAIGISTPAISGKHWDNIPGHYWDYFQQAFKTEGLEATKAVATQLSLFGVMDHIECPVLIFHGCKDNVSQPDALELFKSETKGQLTTRVYPKSAHCCLDKMSSDVLPYAIEWFEKRI